MKAVQTKAEPAVAKSNHPFFNKNGDGSFLHNEKNSQSLFNSQQPSFFNAGNRTVQTKLTIGEPDDMYEKEADAMADKVVQRLSEPCAAPSGVKENTLQRKPVAAAAQISPLIQTKCAACEEEEKLQKKEEDEILTQEKIRRKPAFETNPPPVDDDENIQRKCAACEREDEKKLQKKGEANSPQSASPSIESTLSSSKGSGSPLPLATRSQMENSFGADFSNVKIHTGSSAVQMSRDLHAQAFTHGSDIYFNSGKYDTSSTPGKHLLAHELTHVVQQANNTIHKHIQCSQADDLIESNTTLGFLNEENLGKEIAKGLPLNIDLANEVINKVGNTDKDDVAYEITNAAEAKLGQVPEVFRMRLVSEMVYGIVTGDEEDKIADIWISFSLSLPEVAERNRALWKKSLWESNKLEGYTSIEREAFKRDVEGLALTYLNQNKISLDEEAGRYGINLEGTEPLAERNGYLDSVLSIAPGIVKLRKDIEDLKQIKVGYNPASDCMIGECKWDAYFNPDRKPSMPPDNTESPPWPTWEQTKMQFDRITAVISSFASIYPSIYLLIQQDKLDSFSGLKDTAKAKAEITNVLSTTNVKIKEAKEKVRGTDIEYYDLIMLQSQLFSGASKSMMDSSFSWEKAYYQDIAQDVLKGHEAREFWVNMGLSLVAAAAIIAAPFTGGATAAFLVGFGIGIGAGQAGLSWDKYLDLSTAADATVKEELAIISKGQVSAQLVDAIIQTVAVFLDVYGARSATTAARATRSAIEAAEKDLRQAMEAEAKARMVSGALKESALTLGASGLSAILYELSNDEPVPDFNAQASHTSVDLPGEPTTNNTSGSINRMLIQRAPENTPTPSAGSVTPKQPIRLSGPEFELYIERGLIEGSIGGLPPMNFVIPGQYNGSGWGIDRFGILIDETTGKVSLYHFEMKFVEEGSMFSPTLGKRLAGTQTGLAWTEKAVDGLLTSQHPVARAARERLRRALQSMHPGEYIDIARMRTFLQGQLVNAPVHIVVPNYADLRRLYKQVAALVRWGREARVLRVAIPK